METYIDSNYNHMIITVSILTNLPDYSEYYIRFFSQEWLSITRTEYYYSDFLEQIELSFWMIENDSGFIKEQLYSVMIIWNVPLIVPFYNELPHFWISQKAYIIQFSPLNSHDNTEEVILESDIRVVTEWNTINQLRIPKILLEMYSVSENTLNITTYN